MDSVNLANDYYDLIVGSIDEKGVYPHQMLVLQKNGKVGVYALALTEPHQVLNTMMKVLVDEKPAQLIFGMDRFTKPGQGTTLSDCVAGAFWNGDAWRVFVIEYQNEPRIVKPMDWDNEFWKKSVKDEIMDFMGDALGQT